MKFSLLLSTAALLALVSGDPIISITSPLSGTKVKAGTDTMLTWVNPTVKTISQIVLAKGPSNALQPVTTIATNVDTATGKYVWKVPYELENGEYSFEIGTSPDLAFAGPITIEGGVGGTLPPSNATVSTPAAPPSGVSNAAGSAAPSSAPSSHASSPAPAAPNAKAPAAGSSPTGSGAIQLTSQKYLAAAAGAAIIAYQLF
ncbi:hypothetical protein BC941DRAFT_347712 [Chlamydoabsidia padenii]|nr:hypothetical protein BC941DRAFT_347712 [Chlamydoabsidia padenii]